MKNIMRFLIFLICFISINNLWGQAIGNVDKIKIQSEVLNQSREILIYTPAYYKESEYQHFDVVFVFDAQNRQFFDLTHSIISFLDESNPVNPFIVVGISAYTGKEEYARNDDFLPYPKYDKIEDNFYGYGHANRERFTQYLNQEVIPLLNKKYRITSKRLAVGHSLGASYVLSTLINNPSLFSSHIAISPNFKFDEERLANEFINNDFSEMTENKFLFLSHADEDNYWKGWKKSRERVYEFLNSKAVPNISYVIKDYEDKTHLTSFLSAIHDGMKEYIKYIDSLPIKKYNVDITIKVPNKTDEVYITGNQKVLGDWEEGRIKMDSISPFERRIFLNLKDKTQIRFTNGNSKSNKVADIENYDLPWFFYIPISAEYERNLNFKVIDWTENSF